ncbi:hypothetical protein GCM10023322_55490 [Rugosimonospora acidiphila]|uniref:Uncharacterized protein n=1 Tax=Rugosimonospora acidiphila TaxID=556531 RepID=A0ABP9SC30_9ACTN
MGWNACWRADNIRDAAVGETMRHHNGVHPSRGHVTRAMFPVVARHLVIGESSQRQQHAASRSHRVTLGTRDAVAWTKVGVDAKRGRRRATPARPDGDRPRGAA